MKNIHIKVLIYGLYAVLCHVCGIFLYYSVNSSALVHEVLVSCCSEMLEYSLMSALIVTVGGMLLSISTKEKTQQ